MNSYDLFWQAEVHHSLLLSVYINLLKMSRDTSSSWTAWAPQSACWQHYMLTTICASLVISVNTALRKESTVYQEVWEEKYFYIKLVKKGPQKFLAEVSRKAGSLLTMGGYPSSWKRENQACEAPCMSAWEIPVPRESLPQWSAQIHKNQCCADMNLKCWKP